MEIQGHARQNKCLNEEITFVGAQGQAVAVDLHNITGNTKESVADQCLGIA